MPGMVGARGLQCTPYQPDQGQGAVASWRASRIPPCLSHCELLSVKNGSPKGICRVLQFVGQGWGQEAGGQEVLPHWCKEFVDSVFVLVAADCWWLHLVDTCGGLVFRVGQVAEKTVDWLSWALWWLDKMMLSHMQSLLGHCRHWCCRYRGCLHHWP